MRVFVLCTGRCGSTTLAEAFAHASNYTVDHESRRASLATRDDYPDQHIEVDNRLSWFLGALDEAYGDEPWYVHLTRDADAVAASYHRRWEQWIVGRRPVHTLARPLEVPDRVRTWWLDPSTEVMGIAPAFGYGVVMQDRAWTCEERLRVCDLYVQTVTQNIDLFLRDKTRVEHVAVETFAADVSRLWERIGAEGDLERALHELTVRHNRS